MDSYDVKKYSDPNCINSVELKNPVCNKCKAGFKFESLDSDICVSCSSNLTNGCFLCDIKAESECLIC